MNRKTILFVDDEPKILKGLRRMLYPLREEWNMLFVESGAEALETLHRTRVDVLISDMRMPQMNGVQLLQVVKQQNPEIVRVMLTGQPDMETYREVMTVSHYFLWKPTSLEEFEALFSRVKYLDKIFKHDALKQLIGGINSLPSLPILFSRLTTLLDKEDVDSAQIADVIKGDMAMTAQVLKLVNSSFVGLVRRVETLEEAVTYLGGRTINSLVLIQQLFSQCTREEISAFQLDTLWEHSFCVATLARKIASDTNKSPLVHDYAYLAGLLHDIGKLLIATQLADSYRSILDKAELGSTASIEVERELLGADHAAIGGYLTSLWGLPRTITEAVCLHHAEFTATTSESSPVLYAVSHADNLCHGGYNRSGDYKELTMPWQQKNEQ